MKCLFNLLTLCWSLKEESFTLGLPEDLVCHVISEYLADEPSNRLVNKNVRRVLDEKYAKLSGIRNERGLMVLEGVLRLKSGNRCCSLVEYLNDENPRVRRMSVRLLVQMRRRFADPPKRVIFRLLIEAGSLQQFLLITRLLNGYEAFRQSLRADQIRALDDKYATLRRETVIEEHPISYSFAFRGR